MTQNINEAGRNAEGKKVDDTFESNFGEILHHHSQTLGTLFQGLESVVNYLGDGPFEGETSPDEVDMALAQPVILTLRAIEKIFQQVGDSWRQRGVPDDFQRKLTDIQDDLRAYVNQPSEGKYRPPYVQAKMGQLLKLFQHKNQLKIASELVKDVVQKAREVQRLICIHELNDTMIRISDMEQQTKALRDFYLTSVSVQETPQVLEVSRLVKEVIRELDAYAKVKRIRIDPVLRVGTAKVLVPYKNTLRAFSNVLHNAIKYNYPLKGEGQAYVRVEARADGDSVFISFENWGVPIAQDEIDRGLIFRAGWRGTYARLKDWSGNGIGLAQALTTVKQQGGDIMVKSAPAVPQGDRLDYTKPFTTTVTIRLPKASATG